MESKTRAWKWGCGTLLVFGGMLVGAWVMRETQVNRLVHKQREEAKRLGISLNPDDYNKTDFPKSENAAPRYEAVISKLKGREKATYAIREAVLGSKSLNEAELTKQLLPFQAEITETLAATKLPHYRWKRPYEKGFELVMPELASLRDMGALLIAESRLSANRGDKARAVEYAVGAIRIGRHLRNGPFLIGQLVAEIQLTPAMWNAAKLMALLDDPTVTKTLMAEIEAVEPMTPRSWGGSELLVYHSIAQNPRAKTYAKKAAPKEAASPGFPVFR
jgi:hypothetical protein